MNLREKNLSLITECTDERDEAGEYDPDPVVNRRALQGKALASPRGGEDLDQEEVRIGRGIHRG